jgi:hypothetical protein
MCHSIRTDHTGTVRESVHSIRTDHTGTCSGALDVFCVIVGMDILIIIDTDNYAKFNLFRIDNAPIAIDSRRTTEFP